MTIKSTIQIVTLLRQKKHSIHMLTEATGLSRVTISRTLRSLKAEQMAHIASFDKDSMGRKRVALWRFGPGEDAARQPVDGATRNKLYLKRRKRRKRSVTSK